MQVVAYGNIARRPAVAGRSRVRGAGLFGRILKLAYIVGGLLVMIAGFLIAPLPGPFGLPIAVVGLAIILRNSTWAKRRFIDAKKRWPNWVYPFRRLMRKRPEFAAVFWQQALRVERLVVRRGSRFMGSLRRRTLRRRPSAA